MFILLLSQGKAPQELSGRTCVFSCLLTATKDPENFVGQASILHVYQGELIVRSRLILPLTSFPARRAERCFSRWKEVWLIFPPCQAWLWLMWDQKSALWKQKSQLVLLFQIHGGAGKGVLLSDTPRCAL